MEDGRVDELIDKFDRYMQSIENNKEASIDFLIGAGILDEKGELEPRYKEICTLPEQD